MLRDEISSWEMIINEMKNSKENGNFNNFDLVKEKIEYKKEVNSENLSLKYKDIAKISSDDLLFRKSKIIFSPEDNTKIINFFLTSKKTIKSAILLYRATENRFKVK